MSVQLLILGAVIVLMVLLSLRKRRGDLSPAEAHELVGRGALLLDVRTAGEFANGHIDKAKNIPVQELSGRMGELRKDVPVVVYCLSGSRSAVAARTLRQAGFATVRNLGAMTRW